MLKKNKPDIISIIGYGRVGASLSFALHTKGYKVYIYSKTIAKKLLPKKYFLDNLMQAIEIANAIFICVPDDIIENMADTISNLNLNLSEKIFYHTSGSKSSSSLEKLKKNNAFIASFHPLQTFPYPNASLRIWHNIYCVLEGDDVGIKKARQYCNELKCKYLVLNKEDKLLYHAAAVFTSNFLVLLIHISQTIASYAGIDKNAFNKLYSPLIKATLKSIEKMGLDKALSGPLVRKDYNTLIQQVNKIKERNETISSLYNLFIQYYNNTFYSKNDS